MSRIGFSDTEESIETIRKIASLPGIEIEGMFTHFAKADELDKTNRKTIWAAAPAPHYKTRWG